MNIVYMGDSLTVGVYSDGTLRYDRENYPKLVDKYLKSKNLYTTSYNIAVSGFTTLDVLNMLTNDLTYNENVAYNIIPESCYRRGNKDCHTVKLLKNDKKISTIIKNADHIIMTLGSNDFIKYIETYPENLKENITIKNIVENHKVTIIAEELIDIILVNYQKIIDYISELNADTKITLFGSYTPHKSAIINKIMAKQVKKIEQYIFSKLEKTYTNVEYIPIRDDNAVNKSKYLDNPLNIHPKIYGYQIFA